MRVVLALDIPLMVRCPRQAQRKADRLHLHDQVKTSMRSRHGHPRNAPDILTNRPSLPGGSTARIMPTSSYLSPNILLADQRWWVIWRRLPINSARINGQIMTNPSVTPLSNLPRRYLHHPKFDQPAPPDAKKATSSRLHGTQTGHYNAVSEGALQNRPNVSRFSNIPGTKSFFRPLENAYACRLRGVRIKTFYWLGGGRLKDN